jgi:hypothetical protein
MTWLSMHLDFGLRLVEAPTEARAVAEVLIRPCFAALGRLSARRKDRWSRHGKPSVDAIAGYVTDPSLDAVSLDTERGQEIVATAQVDNGVGRPSAPVPETRCSATIVIPYVAEELEATVGGVCDLARIVRAAGGFVALEASYGLAHEVALGGFRPRERVGVSEQRFRERRARGQSDDRLANELAGVEWGTFLGSGHLARIQLDQVRSTDAFVRVAELVPQELTYLQVTEDPLDDLTEAFEAKLGAARRALMPLMMDVSGVSLE